MPRLVITDPKNQTQIFEISSPTVNIGRAVTNDLVLAHSSVSRHHARLTVLPGGTVFLNDLGSMNGTTVNGQSIQEYHLKDQDQFALGMYSLRFDATVHTPVHIESSTATGELDRLVSPESLSTALKPQPLADTAQHLSVEERIKSLEQENRTLKLLLGVGKTLSSVLIAEEIMQRVMELVFQMDNVERGFVMLRDEKGGFKPAVMIYKDEDTKDNVRGLALSQTVIDRVTTERLPLLIHDVEGDERFSSSASLRLSGIRSAMCAPLLYQDRVFGLFYVDCLSKPFAFSKDELSIFSVIAAEAAMSFDNARSHEELSRSAMQRQAFERYLNTAIVDRIMANPGEIQLGGENLSATILFADIRGFTRMSGNMAPEVVVELLNEYFTEMTDVIFDNGGTLDKYLGDGMMAVFGAPIARHDDAARSAKTAIEMQRSLAALNRQWQARGQNVLRVGIGINTGQVTAGNIGSSKRMDYTVIGDAVNLASRLCSNAAGGQILISELTQSQLQYQFATRRLQPILVKGKETPVEVHEVVWEDAAPGVSGPCSSAAQA
jgi:adenylate cyclase